MATLVIGTETAMAVELFLNTVPASTYSPDIDSAERAEPGLQGEMDVLQESGVRNRVVVARLGSTPPSNESPRVSTAGSDDVNAREEIQEESATPTSLDESTWMRVLQMPPLPWSVKETDEEKEEYDIKHGFDKLRTERVDDFQEGIPQLAAFLNSNDSFTHHRKWGQITNRVLLYRSIELAQLSKKLSDLDNEYASDDTKKYCLKGWEPENWGKEQKDLILEIEKKLEIYHTSLLRYNHVCGLRQTPPGQLRSLFNWVWNNKPLAEDKVEFMFMTDDFISIGNPNSDMRATNMLESFVNSHPRLPLKKFLQTKREVDKTDDPFVTHYSSDRFNLVIRILSALIAVTILLLPVLLLFLVTMSKRAMAGLVVGSVLCFAAIMALMTEARFHQVLVGSCAYGAVLVTFLGNMERGGGA